MTTFFGALFSITGILLLCSLPVLIVARRQKRPQVARRFLVAAGSIGLFFAASAAASEQLKEDCGASGSIACLDVGFVGLLYFVAGGYIIAALVVAIVIGRQ